MSELLIFTDLDGTLLDHKTYRYDAAKPALNILKQRSISLILATSKTAAEIEPLHEELGLQSPAIVENGGGVWFADAKSRLENEPNISLNLTRAEILKRLDILSPSTKALFRGFSAMPIAEIVERTGLDDARAHKANLRDWSEPGVWLGEPRDFDVFSAELASANISVKRGGRFIHLMGNTSKAQQMSLIRRLFEREGDGARIYTAALGDAPNDQEMIEAADYGFIIPNPNGMSIPHLRGETQGKIQRMENAGPAGWNEAVLSLLERFEITSNKGV